MRKIEKSNDYRHKFFHHLCKHTGRFEDSFELKSYRLEYMRIAVSGVNVSL